MFVAWFIHPQLRSQGYLCLPVEPPIEGAPGAPFAATASPAPGSTALDWADLEKQISAAVAVSALKNGRIQHQNIGQHWWITSLSKWLISLVSTIWL